jgi:putative ABC transport system permease protein
MLSDDDVKKARPFIVIPEEAALSLLGKSDATGGTIPVNLASGSVNMTVVGVYRPEKSIFTAMMPSDSFTVYAPYTLWKGGVSAVLDFYVNENYDIGATCKQMIKYISITKKKPEDIYESGDVNSQQSKINGIMGAMSIAIGAIAAISLVVGGIGIMNIMLVSVTERTREIGIRKSLGARTGDILQQFLIESMIVSSIGGLVGTVLGNCIAAVGLRFAGAAIHVNPVVVLLAVGFSAAVGMFFGLYPARKAAMMNPIEALRYE